MAYAHRDTTNSGKKCKSSALVMLLALAFVAATVWPDSSVAAPPKEETVAPPAEETSAPAASLAGTTWDGELSWLDDSTYPYAFCANGDFFESDPCGAKYPTGRWSLAGNIVAFGYEVGPANFQWQFSGTVNGRRMQGDVSLRDGTHVGTFDFRLRDAP